MSAVATKKPDGDRGVQLTFPLNFQKAFDAGFAYFPSGGGDTLDILVGHDFQSKRHEANRLEANQSVMNGLQANASAERKMLTGPHNYHVPKPVLGQRRYANPSYGADTLVSTRRDNGSDAPFHIIEGTDIMMGAGPSARDGEMHGGVLRTSQGYEFYKGQRMKRIDELNRINALAQGFAVPMGQTADTFNNEKEGSPDKVSFFLYLQGLQDAVTSGDYTRFAFNDIKELVGKLLNLGPTASEEDFNDIQNSVTIMINSLRQWNESEAESDVVGDYMSKSTYAMTLLQLLEKIYSYIRVMFANMYRSDKEKVTLSKSLVTALKFNRLLTSETNKQIIEESRRDDERIDQIAEDEDDGPADGLFDRPAMGREDSEQLGAPRAPFAGTWGDANRERWGRRGRPTREGEAPGYFGETAGEEETALVAPLDLSSFDPGAQMPLDVAPPGLGDALKDIMKQTLLPLIDSADEQAMLQNEEFADLITTHYPDPKQFVKELDSAAVERGFTKPQIAAALAQFDMPVFAEYIAANAGNAGPAPIAPAYRYPPAGPQGPAPVYAPPPPAGGEPALPPWLAPVPTRADLRANVRSLAQARQFIATLPPEAGGSYKPRADSSLKNVVETIIRNIRKVVPTY
jgi:hypothetical protein